MPLGVVTDKEFEEELNNVTNGRMSPPVTEVRSVDVNAEMNKPIGRGLGRGTDNPNTPEAIRKLVGMTYATEGRSEGVELAKELGLSESSALAYSVGSTSTATYNKPNDKLKNAVDKAKLRIASRARGTLVRALGTITNDKLNESTAKELSGVAKDMASIASAMEPKSDSAAGSNSPTFVFYSPKIIEEKHFDIVRSSE